MTYKTWTNLRVWLVYFVIFSIIAVGVRIGHNIWKGEPPLSLFEGLTAVILPAVFATGLTYRWGKR